MPDEDSPAALTDLRKSVVAGEELDLSQKIGEDKVIEAQWIRNILINRDIPPPDAAYDPRGIHIRGGSIRGELNLDGIGTKTGLRLSDCSLDTPLTLCDASVPWLHLHGCELESATADRAQIGTLTIAGCTLIGKRPAGIIRLAGTRLANGLEMRGTRIVNQSGPALLAAGLRVGDGDVGAGALLDGLEATGETESGGAVCLSGASISGGLSLHGATLSNDAGPAFMADGLSVQGDVLMTGDAVAGRFYAAGAGGRGTIRLMRATITGQLSLDGADVENRAAGPGAPAGGRDRGGPDEVHSSARFAGTGDAPRPRGPRTHGAVCLSGAVISGNLVLRHAILVGGAGPALLAENLTVKGHAGYCENPGERFRATASSELGTVCLPGAAITGQLSLCGTSLENDRGPALMAELVTIGEDAVLEGFTATGAGGSGAVRLTEARISGNLSMLGATLRNDSGPALVADGLTVQDVMLSAAASASLFNASGAGAFTATGAGAQGTVRLMRATITGQLSLDGANVESRVPAQVMPAGAPGSAATPASRSRSLGAVCLSGAAISGDLVLRQATLTGGAGPALLADYLTVKGDAAVCEQPADGFIAIGSGDLGAVCLAGATITGQLSLCGTTLVNLSGPALVAAFAQIQGDAFLGQNFTALGTGESGSVHLAEATFGKALVCSGVLVNRQGPALDLTRAKAGLLRLGSGFAAGRVQGFSTRGQVEFEGLSYAGVPRLGDDSQPRGPRSRGHSTTEKDKVEQWLRWFRGTSRYAAQPYQALAAAYEGAGYDNFARHILVRQCDDARARGSLTGVRRAGQFCSKWLIGYGYHCVRALAWLAVLFVAAALLAIVWFGPARYIVTASTPGQAASTSASAASAPVARECSVTGDIGYAIEVAFPVININSASGAQCDVPANGAKLGMIVFGWVIRVLAALLAAVYVLGISGLNRSSPSGSSS